MGRAVIALLRQERVQYRFRLIIKRFSAISGNFNGRNASASVMSTHLNGTIDDC